MDLAIDPLDVVNERGFAWTTSKALGDVPDDDGPDDDGWPMGPSDWALDHGFYAWGSGIWGFGNWGFGIQDAAASVCWARVKLAPKPRQQLEHKRAVVLLI